MQPEPSQGLVFVTVTPFPFRNHHSLQVFFHVHRRPAPRASRGNRLPVVGVHDIAAGKDAFNAGGGIVQEGFHIPHGVSLQLSIQKLGVRIVPDGNKQSLGRQDFVSPVLLSRTSNPFT
jgi:hypothetical protein